MKKGIHFSILIITGLFFVFGCSTQKNKMLNRGYHTLNTKYNVLFNGNEAFEVGKAILEQAHDDNFFQLLEVEPITINGESFEQSTIVPGFTRAEEKAVKAIQKHSMNIKGIQRNTKIDEAYLLLGKARYFDRRFFPAMEAFNYLLENYADRNTYVEGRIWREKTNIRLKNDELAIKNLRTLALTISPKSKFHSMANATLAQAFINTQQLDSANYFIRRASISAKKNKDKGRYYFLTGQLFENLQKPDSALWAYEQVVGFNRKIPRKYWINAKIKQLHIRSIRDSIDPVESLEKLNKNYENEIFDHWINRALGLHFFGAKNDSLGAYYLSKSLKSINIDLPTKAANYRDMADFNFANGKYVLTGAYLDSLLPLIPEATLAKRTTQRERDNLDGVIKYETVVRKTDSILQLLSMDKVDQVKYFEYFIKEKEAKALAQVTQQEKGVFSFLSKGGKTNQFYFYNPKLVVRGQQEFLSSWGNRPNTDNWAIAAAINPVIQNNQSTLTQEKNIEQENFFVEKPESYINALPKTTEAIDSIKKANQNAYLQLGMIYKENFKNNKLAEDRLTHLIDLEPPANIAAPALYHLFKINEKTLPQKAKQYFDRIVSAYPETAYGKVLINPEDFDRSTLNTPEAMYNVLLKLYQSGDFDTLRERASELSVFLSGTQYQPKFELLLANTKGRLQGINQWEKELAIIQTKYAETSVGDLAEEIIAQIKMTDTIEKQNKTYINYKWIFTYQIQDSTQLKSTKVQLQKALNQAEISRWFLTEDRFDETRVFLVLHGIRSIRKLNEWKKNIDQLKLKADKKNNFVVLSSDYKRMIRDKKVQFDEK